MFILFVLMIVSFSSYAADYQVVFTYNKGEIEKVNVPHDSVWKPSHESYEVDQPYNNFVARKFGELVKKRNKDEIYSFWKIDLLLTIVDNVDGVFFLYNRIKVIGAKKLVPAELNGARLVGKCILTMEIATDDTAKIDKAVVLLDKEESSGVFPLYDALCVVKAVEQHFVWSKIPALVKQNVSPQMRAILFPTVVNRVSSLFPTISTRISNWYSSLHHSYRTALKWLGGLGLAGTAAYFYTKSGGSKLYSPNSSAAYGKLR